MRKTLFVVLALVLVSGCKSKGDDNKVPPKPAEPSGASATSASAEPAAAQPKLANQLFTGPKVGLPAPIAAIALRGTTDAAKQAAPWLFAKDYGVEIEGYQDVKVNADLTSDDAFVRDLRLTLPTPLEESRTFLTAVWGEPRAVDTVGGGKRYEWTDADAGLRAYIDEQGSKTRMIYEPVMSIETFLGTEAGRFGFEKLALLGAAEADVKTAYAAWLSAGGSAERISIGLPSLDVSEYEGSVSLDLADGKVVKMTIQISFSYDKAAKDAILAGLEKKFGAATKGDMYIDYPGPPKVKVDFSSDDQLVIWVGGE